MPAPFYVFRPKKSVGELREDKKRDDKKNKKSKAKPYINPKNKILLNTRHNLGEQIRESNRTKILMDLEYTP
jgi:hypothetical protein